MNIASLSPKMQEIMKEIYTAMEFDSNEIIEIGKSWRGIERTLNIMERRGLVTVDSSGYRYTVSLTAAAKAYMDSSKASWVKAVRDEVANDLAASNHYENECVVFDASVPVENEEQQLEMVMAALDELTTRGSQIFGHKVHANVQALKAGKKLPYNITRELAVSRIVQARNFDNITRELNALYHTVRG